MTHAIEVPAWLLALGALFALWALWDHVLAPGWRALMSRSANQVIDELSARLRIGIRPWQRTRRQALIHRLITDPRVLAAAEQFAKDSGTGVGGIKSATQGYFSIGARDGDEMGSGSDSPYKKVRVVTTVDFYLD